MGFFEYTKGAKLMVSRIVISGPRCNSNFSLFNVFSELVDPHEGTSEYGLGLEGFCVGHT